MWLTQKKLIIEALESCGKQLCKFEESLHVKYIKVELKHLLTSVGMSILSTILLVQYIPYITPSLS